ncbi:MAG: transporter [Syntrophomonadaceae bacterium]|nr:transporter [Syntrophomonadaceae bacterium]
MKAQLLWLFSSIFLGAGGQILLKYGVNQMGEIDLSRTGIIFTISNIFTNLFVISGICFFVASMILWIKVISTMELSRAYPSVSLSYIIVFLFSIAVFEESVTAGKLAGLLLVIAGVYFLNT